MTEQEVTLLLLRDEFELLKKYISTRIESKTSESLAAAQLQAEFESAQVIEDASEAPSDLVEVEDVKSGRKMKFKLVLPADADVKKEKLSIFAPLGIALMGYRQGNHITWRMPSGNKTFKIISVAND